MPKKKIEHFLKTYLPLLPNQSTLKQKQTTSVRFQITPVFVPRSLSQYFSFYCTCHMCRFIVTILLVHPQPKLHQVKDGKSGSRCTLRLCSCKYFCHQIRKISDTERERSKRKYFRSLQSIKVQLNSAYSSDSINLNWDNHNFISLVKQLNEEVKQKFTNK